ncbi:hypothetical protein DMH12_04410 [Streptomyces sp. WAC 04229]|uniref:hypothetical protein n=1 Tax=Streptomyces sp. WAC 04229 TaxID=2203206 RepID=UPI000F7452FC|nr:hypothetical protein [Streptomyces sp. WAC 04229]RSN64021.1 hypothetical protein DMH12_04410 [Streptomyces sp. WAC 04229]
MIACEVCRDDSDGKYLCGRHAVKLARALGSLPVLFAELELYLVPPRRGPADFLAASPAGPRSPVNEDVIDLVAAGHAALVLEGWRADVQRVRWPEHGAPPVEGGMTRRVQVACRWLLMEVDWIVANYPAAADLLGEVQEVERAALTIAGDPPPRAQRLGYCIGHNLDGSICGAVIARVPGQTRLRCRWCCCVYDSGQDWLRLLAGQPKEVA